MAHTTNRAERASLRPVIRLSPFPCGVSGAKPADITVFEPVRDDITSHNRADCGDEVANAQPGFITIMGELTGTAEVMEQGFTILSSIMSDLHDGLDLIPVVGRLGAGDIGTREHRGHKIDKSDRHSGPFLSLLRGVAVVRTPVSVVRNIA